MHITQDVLECLNGDYVVEEGNGKERDAFLKQYNIQTYLVVANEHTKVCTHMTCDIHLLGLFQMFTFVMLFLYYIVAIRYMKIEQGGLGINAVC